MEEIIRSKFLLVTPSKENESCLVIHERNQTVIEVALDVIDIIDQYITPRIPDTEDPDEQELYSLLTKIHFLHNKVYAESESYDILNSWMCQYKKERKSLQYQNIRAIYAARAKEPIQDILIEILKIGHELSIELLPFQQPLLILFLTPVEYQNLQLEFNVPKDISAFIDSRTLLIIDYESYFKKNNTRSFYPTIRHELVHILFGQYAYYIPFWMEEGICEYYSKKYRMDYLNLELKEEALISFVQIDSEKINYISQLEQFENIQYLFYKQVASFVGFLFQTFTEDCIWNIISQSSIRRNFFDVLESEYGIGLIELQNKWELYIKYFPNGT